jgi:tetratricopeptide (TPR) repeat protein
MQIRFKFLPVLILTVAAGVFVSCGGKDVPSDAEKKLADSLGNKLGSPELKALNTKILENPSAAELYDQRAAIYRSLKEFTAAENDSKRAIRLDSTNSAFYMTLADTYFSGNKTRLAKETLEIIETKFPDQNEALLKLAELYFAVRQYQKAIDYTNKALKNDVNNARAYFIKGSVYRESGDTTRAISSLETAIEQDNKFRDAFYDLGIIYAARRNPLALDYYKNALDLDPRNVQVHYARAKFLQDVGRTEEAAAGYDALLKNDSTCADCYFNLGAIAVDIKKDYRSAIAFFTKAIGSDPSFAEAYYWRGYSYLQLKDKTSARTDFAACVKLNPDHEAAQRMLNKL